MTDQRQIRISPAHYAELVRRQRNGQSLRGVLAEVLEGAFVRVDAGHCSRCHARFVLNNRGRIPAHPDCHPLPSLPLESDP